ncbi:MAG: intradiol ring-cleavage dioxygenase [Fluviicola sp.]|nr:MAG: intradiol ring-cleavage dioxygenase [Fluviicola sp.]
MDFKVKYFQGILVLFLFIFSSCNAQTKTDSNQITNTLVGGPCEGCEAIFEYDNRKLTHIDTLPDFYKEGVKIKVEGTIYQPDGKTPAKNIILYVYHTNQEGVYAPKENAKGWAKKHGYNRSWIKTDKNGHYSFYTLKPAPYPNRSDPAHIHYTILEPNGKYYWLGSCHFKGDTLLTKNEIKPDSPRGGSSGLLILKKEGDLYVGRRDIILGLNIPNYE